MTAQPTRPKPPYKAPCNHCGRCCHGGPCSIGKLFFKTDRGPCPGLRWDRDGASACSLVLDPGRHVPTRTRAKGVTVMREAARLLVLAGTGCTMRAPDEPADPEFVKRARGPVDRQQRARKTWGIPNDATPLLLDKDRLEHVLGHVGRTLTTPAFLCVIGAVPGILRGQPGRRTHDIDVWGPESRYAETELRRAFLARGIEMYNDGELHGPARENYIEVTAPGVSARIMERAFVQVVMPGRRHHAQRVRRRETCRMWPARRRHAGAVGSRRPQAHSRQRPGHGRRAVVDDGSRGRPRRHGRGDSDAAGRPGSRGGREEFRAGVKLGGIWTGLHTGERIVNARIGRLRNPWSQRKIRGNMKSQICDRPFGGVYAWIDGEDILSSNTGKKCAVLREGAIYDLKGRHVGMLTPLSTSITGVEPSKALEKFMRLAGGKV